MNKKILAFFAHPDDETILSGGIFALLAREGFEIYFLSATRGEGGEVGEPPISTQEKLGDLREEEMKCAVEELGGVRVDFLDYVDPLIGENDELHAYTEDIETLVLELKGYIHGLEPYAIFTHGSNGEYGHPAHLITHQSCVEAVDRLIIKKPIVYGVSAFFDGHMKPRVANKDDHADLIVDIESVFENKYKAAMCHKSQNALFVRRSSREAGRQLSVREVLMRTESLHRFSPKLTDVPEDEIMNALQPYIISPTE